MAANLKSWQCFLIKPGLKKLVVHHFFYFTPVCLSVHYPKDKSLSSRQVLAKCTVIEVYLLDTVFGFFFPFTVRQKFYKSVLLPTQNMITLARYQAGTGSLLCKCELSFWASYVVYIEDFNHHSSTVKL